jgi:hypothetical protein
VCKYLLDLDAGQSGRSGINFGKAGRWQKVCLPPKCRTLLCYPHSWPAVRMNFDKTLSDQAIPVAARSKAWVCGRSIAGISGSNPSGDMYVCLLCLVLSLRRADHSCRGGLPTVSVMSKPCKRRPYPEYGPKRHQNKILCDVLSCSLWGQTCRSLQWCFQSLSHCRVPSVALFWTFRFELSVWV